MNLFSKACTEITFRIPPQILAAVFQQRHHYNIWKPVSVEQQIMDLVIRPRVFVDCQIIGGREVVIPLRGTPRERISENVTVYKVPKDLTQNSTIISVLNIGFIDPARMSTYGTPTYGFESPMLTQAQGMVDAMGTIPSISTAYCSLIGENVVMVRDASILPTDVYLRCRLAYDEDMSHIQLRSYHVFANLVEYAVKSYIYNTYRIEMDSAEIRSGGMLGTFRQEIDSYADAEQNYRDYLKNKVMKVLFMNDDESYRRYLKLVNGGLR